MLEVVRLEEELLHGVIVADATIVLKDNLRHVYREVDHGLHALRNSLDLAIGQVHRHEVPVVV